MIKEFDIGSVLIFIGILLIIFGIVWKVGGSFIPIGRLPGDIAIDRGNWKVYIPIASSIVISILLTLVFWIIRVLNK